MNTLKNNDGLMLLAIILKYWKYWKHFSSVLLEHSSIAANSSSLFPVLKA